jgi:hypothetical protein
MGTYLITFEFQSEKLLEFLERLKRFGSYCPMNPNCWLVIAEHNAAEILQELQYYTNPTKDKLFVLKTGSEAAWSVLYGDAWQTWLNNNLV